MFGQREEHRVREQRRPLAARTLAAKPVRTAGPVFSPGNWDNYFAEVDWTGQFSWWSQKSPEPDGPGADGTP